MSSSVLSDGPILELRGVVKRFGSGLEALAGIDLSVARGEFLSLLGPSGCGKSTLLRVIAGLTRPSAGSSRLAVDHAPGRIGFVFQDPTLMPWSTVTNNVLLPFRIARHSGAKARAKERDRALAAVSAVGLAGFEDAVDEGKSQRQQGIHRAEAQPVDHLLQEHAIVGHHGAPGGLRVSLGYSSFPRMRESRTPGRQRLPWTPAFAGATGKEDIRYDRHLPHHDRRAGDRALQG